jgi:hypothetical protein
MAWALRKQSAGPDSPPVLKAVPSPTPSPVTRGRPKRLAVFRLYPVPEASLERQIEVMIDEVAEFVPADAYVPSRDLQRYYRELCERKEWRAQDWSLAGHVLGKVCERAIQKTGGVRQVVYRIPCEPNLTQTSP